MSSPAVQLRSRMPRLSPQMAQAAVERARLTVVPRRRTRAARLPFVALVSLVLLGGVVGLLLFNTSMQQASFAATSLEEQARVLSAREQTLQMEIDALRDPQHVAAQAQQMGMVVAPAPVFLDSRTGKVLGTPAPATPVDRLRLLPKPAARPAILNPAPIVVPAPVATTASHHGTGSDSTRDTRADGRDTRGAGGTHGNKPDRSHQNRR